MPKETIEMSGHGFDVRFDGQALISLLEKLTEVCRRLKQQAVQQKVLICREDPTPLLTVLADRQKLTDELGRLSGRLGPMPHRLDAVAFVSEAQRRRAEGLLTEVRQAMRRILVGDGEDVRKLKVRIKTVGSALQAVGARREMLSAYARVAGAKVLSQDRTDEQG